MLRLFEGSNRCVKWIVKEAQLLRKVGQIHFKLLCSCQGSLYIYWERRRQFIRLKPLWESEMNCAQEVPNCFLNFTQKSPCRREICQVVHHLCIKIGLRKFYRHIISDGMFPFIGTIWRYCLCSHKHMKSIQHSLFSRDLVVEVHLRRSILCLSVNSFLVCHQLLKIKYKVYSSEFQYNYQWAASFDFVPTLLSSIYYIKDDTGVGDG